jgi:hypothetical protein
VRRIAVAGIFVLGACSPLALGPSAPSPLTPPPAWSVRVSAGLRVTAPSDWIGPEDLPTQNPPGDPTRWLVFRDTSGDQIATIMVWPDATVDTIVATYFQGLLSRDVKRHGVTTLVDAQATRPAVEPYGWAQWSGPGNGAGTYECRHVLIQVATVVADVIACGARGSAASTVSVDQMRTQDRVAIRLIQAG